jgi:hypothetical protein
MHDARRTKFVRQSKKIVHDAAPLLGRFFKIADDGTQEPGRLSAGDGAMVEGQR